NDNHSLDLTYDGGHKDTGLAWKGRYYGGDMHYQYHDAPDPASGSYNDKNRTVYQGAQGQLSFTKDFLTLTGGLDWQQHRLRGNNENGKGSAFFEKERHSSSTYEVGAGFLLAKLAFWDELLIVGGGVRQDTYAVKAGDSFTPSSSKEFDHTTPSVGVAVNPLKWLTLRGNYGESYQAPTPMQLMGGSWSAFYGRYIGNSHLKPERGEGWDAGFDMHDKAWNLGLTYFSTDYRDKIGVRPVGGDNQYYNVGGTVYYRGIEAQAGYDLGDAFAWPFMLRPYANLTQMLECRGRGQDPAKPDSYAPMRNISDTSLAYGLQFKYPDIGLEADLRATYYGYRKELVYDSAAWTSDMKRAGGETVVDFFAAQTLHKWEDAGKLSLKGEVRNLTNVKHEAFANYPLPGRSFWLGLRYDY
ncbi:MAG: TonB-dependent receptor, partial [Deltaproteobacteria bacterium]|nr:TonB-dependent receptor [Deltaproteobacteria bacterium]